MSLPPKLVPLILLNYLNVERQRRHLDQMVMFFGMPFLWLVDLRGKYIFRSIVPCLWYVELNGVFLKL
jgi:hypothetical protein